MAIEGTASPGDMATDAEAFGSVGRDGGSAGSVPATTIILPSTIVITIRGGATAGLSRGMVGGYADGIAGRGGKDGCAVKSANGVTLDCGCLRMAATTQIFY